MHSMVRWYHLILCAYGFWLPNDPRGSWSDFVGSWELFKFGPPTKVSDSRNYAKDPHDVALRRAAKEALIYPPVRFDDVHRNLIADGFATAVREAGYLVHACCVGHDHAHLVIARHARPIETIARHLKSKATMALTRNEAHPLKQYRKSDGAIPTPWSDGQWNVFIEDEEQLRAAVGYVERHPMKEGLARQEWTFIRRR
jgi:REP element-mobilizing transposase RayT